MAKTRARQDRPLSRIRSAAEKSAVGSNLPRRPRQVASTSHSGVAPMPSPSRGATWPPAPPTAGTGINMRNSAPKAPARPTGAPWYQADEGMAHVFGQLGQDSSVPHRARPDGRILDSVLTSRGGRPVPRGRAYSRLEEPDAPMSADDVLASVQPENMSLPDIGRTYGWDMAGREARRRNTEQFEAGLERRHNANREFKRQGAAARLGISPDRLDYVPHNQPGYSRWFPRPKTVEPAPDYSDAPTFEEWRADPNRARGPRVGVGRYEGGTPEPRQQQAPVMPTVPSRDALLAGRPALGRTYSPEEYAARGEVDAKNSQLEKYLAMRRDQRNMRNETLMRPFEERRDAVHAREKQKADARRGRMAYRAQMQLPMRPLTADEQLAMRDPRAALAMRGQEQERQSRLMEFNEKRRQAEEQMDMERDRLGIAEKTADADIETARARAEAARSETELNRRGLEEMDNELSQVEEQMRDMDPTHPMYAELEQRRLSLLEEQEQAQQAEQPSDLGSGDAGLRPQSEPVTRADASRYDTSPLRTRLGLPDDITTMTPGDLTGGVIAALRPGEGGVTVGMSDADWNQAAGWAAHTRALRPGATAGAKKWSHHGVHQELLSMSRHRNGSAEWKRSRDRAAALAKWHNEGAKSSRTGSRGKPSGSFGHRTYTEKRTGPTVGGYQWTGIPSGPVDPMSGRQSVTWSWKKVD